MKIRKRIRKFVFLAVFLPLLVISFFNYWIINEQVKDNQNHYLEVSMLYFDEILLNRKNKVEGVAKALFVNDYVSNAVKNDDVDVIRAAIAEYDLNVKSVDYVVALNSKGEVLAKSNSDEVYKPSKEFLEILEDAKKSGEVMSIVEKIPVSALYSKDTETFNKMCKITKVPFDEDGENHGTILTRIYILPVYDGSEFVGTFVVADVVNGDKVLINSFNQRVKKAYFAILLNNRPIVSNIGDEVCSEYKTSKKDDRTVTKAFFDNSNNGNKYLIAQGDKFVYVEQPILNNKGEEIAKIEIGMPTDSLKALWQEKVKYVAMFILVVLLVSSYLASRLGRTFSNRIEKIIELVQDYGKIDINKITVKNKTEDEIALLSEAFKLLIESIKLKEEERNIYLEQVKSNKEEIKKLAEQLKYNNDCLELVVDEKTKELHLVISELKEADKAKTGFLARISHELRTPLNVISGASQILKEGIFGSLNEKQIKYVDNIQESGDHLLCLINDVLDISKISCDKVLVNSEEFFVSTVVERAVKAINVVAMQRNLNIVFKIEPSDFKVRIDLNKFLQILYNLLSNAVKFTDDNGNITIIVKKREHDFEVKVKDDGIGIDESDIERVFVEFEQVESAYSRKYSGTGLGLPIIKKLVELHGGEVQLISKIGVGTEVSIVLPLDVDEYFNNKTKKESEEIDESKDFDS